MSAKIKELLSAAADATGRADENWHAGGLDRLYFHNQDDLNSAGSVEVKRGEEEPAYVRVELWIRPETAAQIITLVTGDAQALEARLRFEIEREVKARLEVERAAEEEEPSEEMIAARPPVVPTVQEMADAARSAELSRIIKEQAADAAAAEIA